MTTQDLKLTQSASVRSSGRATKPVNYNSMALGTGDVSAAMDYNNVSETTPTHTKGPSLKYGKQGIQVNTKHLKKCQELLRNIQASHFWSAVAGSVAVCEKKDMLQQ